MGRGLLVLSLIVAGACGDVSRVAAPRVSAAASARASPTIGAGARHELVADLQGTTGPDGLLPAGGELSCRGRVVVTIDTRTRPPLGLATASFEIEMSACPEGTVLVDAHVHMNTVPAHPDRVHFGATLSDPLRSPGKGSW